MIQNIYHYNKPLIYSILTGFFYFMFCWSIDIGDSIKGLFIILMIFLPGVTFPFATCYFKKKIKKSKVKNRVLHFVLSVAIYHGNVWLFSGESRIKFITILAGFLGSFLFQLATKFILKKDLALIQIGVIAFISGLSFIPYELYGRIGLLMGVGIFLWTIFNGLLLNIEYKKSIYC